MELDIINRLFLELAQVTTATTAKELRLQQEVADLIDEKSSTQVWVTGLEQKFRASERELAEARETIATLERQLGELAAMYATSQCNLAATVALAKHAPKEET